MEERRSVGSDPDRRKNQYERGRLPAGQTSLDVREHACAIVPQGLRIDTETMRQIRFEFPETIVEQEASATQVAAAGMMKPDPDLQNSLVEIADLAGFGVPLVFDFFMALVVEALVEETDSLQHPRRR